jgi:diaminohydroxyphosphoribosylaminopyrimidine deaminase/5-amino-6-(5-phosphoribosylamino)uracil reductase
LDLNAKMHTMALLLQPSVPSDSPDADAQDLPADWAGLWVQMLRIRHGGASALLPSPRLLHSRQAGWTLNGSCSERSAALFALYKPLLDARQAHAQSAQAAPWLVAQLGQSLDGFVATATGDSYYVTGPQSLVHLHRLRALCDAVLVGAGTVAIDNPQLTTRRVPGPNAVRVVLDPTARLDGQARLFHDGQSPTLWVCDARHAVSARGRLAGGCPQGDASTGGKVAVEPVVVGVEGLLDASGEPCDDLPRRVTEALAERGLRVVFVEGGGMTVSRFFRANALDRLHLVVAPVLIGEGRRGLQAAARPVMAECPRPPARMLVLGDDLLWDLDLRR